MFYNPNRLDEHTRRRFLAGVAKATMGLTFIPTFSSLTSAATPERERVTAKRSKPAKSCIYLFMHGGMSQIDTLDPKPGSKNQGPFKAISTSADGIQLGEHLPLLAKQMKHGAIVRSVSSTQGAHEPAVYYARTSFAPRNTVRHPSMAAWTNYFQSTDKESLPGGIMINSGGGHPLSGFLGSKFAPIPIGDPSAGLKNATPPKGVDMKEMDNRINLLEQFNQSFLNKFQQKNSISYRDMYLEAIKLMHSQDLEAFDISKEPADVKKEYGDSAFGEGCLLARRLVEKGVHFIDITLGGWDTHDDNFNRLEEKLPILDQSLAALVADLEKRGMLQDTLIVLASEFGRQPNINSRGGRDHYPKAYSSLFIGAGIKGGIVHGATNADGTEITEGKVGIPDINATIAYGLGLPLDKVVTSPDGRPFTLADKGQPVTTLFNS